MKFLKLFENFKLSEHDLKAYCEDYWDVDPEYLFELVQHEAEDNSLKKMRFLFEKQDKHNITLIVSDRDKLLVSQLVRSGFNLEDFFNEIKRIEKDKWYPKLFSKMPLKIGESSIYKTSVYFEDIEPNIYFPEIQLGFDKSSIIEDGSIGDWEDHFNLIFEKVGIPYSFDGDSAYFENEIVWYTLYHT